MSDDPPRPRTLRALDATPRTGSAYPPALAAALGERSRRVLGDPFGLRQFGVNLLSLAPGAMSAHRHWHEREDEFVYVLEGEVMLVDDTGEHPMPAGTCAGFVAGSSNAHHLVNRSDRPALCLEVGSRNLEEVAHYADVDMEARKQADGSWRFGPKPAA